MTTPADRLKLARLRAGYRTGTDAARAFGWTESTYLGHENGSRGMRHEAAERYARAFGVKWTWLLSGEGSGPDDTSAEAGLSIVNVLHAATTAQDDRTLLLLFTGLVEPNLTAAVLESLGDGPKHLRDELQGPQTLESYRRKVLLAEGFGIVTAEEARVLMLIGEVREIVQTDTGEKTLEAPGLLDRIIQVVHLTIHDMRSPPIPPITDPLSLLMRFGIMCTTYAYMFAESREKAAAALRTVAEEITQDAQRE